MDKTSCILLFSYILFIIFTLTVADVLPSTLLSPNTACNSTTDPAFCKTILPPKGPENLYTYTRYSLAESLSNAQKFLNIVNSYLARKSSLSLSTIRALEDCQLLSELNIDFINWASGTINSTSSLGDQQTDQLHTLLSAVITNQETCFDGLQAVASALSIRKGLLVPLSNGTKLYSMTLSLFTQAWVPKMTKIKNHKMPAMHPGPGAAATGILGGPIKDGVLPLKMSSANQSLFEQKSGRRLLQSSDADYAVMVSDTVVVSKDGTGNFRTISDAVALAPKNTDGSKGYHLIYVKAGIYEEYVSISKETKYVMMVGDGINQTVVTGSHNDLDGWTTFNSATFAVVGQGFVAINMTFRNTAGPSKHQAVAVRNGANLSTFYTCSFEGYQDTLYTHSMIQFYKNCDIYGTVDFIFGNSAVVFQDCNIYSRLPMSNQQNAIIAQGRTEKDQNTGISIHNCRFLAAPDLASDVKGSTKTYLGRPWKTYSRTVIMESFMDSLIDPAGWQPWNGDFALNTLYYAEYNNNGPGSNRAGRVTWPGYRTQFNAADAINYTVANFVMGDNWLPQTRVPYFSGLRS